MIRRSSDPHRRSRRSIPLSLGSRSLSDRSRDAFFFSGAVAELTADIKCNRCGENKRTLALAWWFGFFVFAGVAGTKAASMLSSSKSRSSVGLRANMASAAAAPSAQALALLSAFDKSGSGALDAAELSTMLAVQARARVGEASAPAGGPSAAAVAKAGKMMSAFDFDGDESLDASELTRALALQAKTRATKVRARRATATPTARRDTAR